MKYVLLVSHGRFAEGLKNAVEMMASERDDLKAVGLEEDMQVADFRKKFESVLSNINLEDEIILFCDILSGSPFTNAVDMINSKSMINRSIVITGMNMPIVLNTVLTKDGKSLEEVRNDLSSLISNTIDFFDYSDSEDEDEYL